jgi:hypothetical protein
MSAHTLVKMGSLSVVLETENRSKLYYSKYKYRARFRLEGLNRTYFTQTIEEYNRRMGLRSVFDSRNPDVYQPIDLASISRYLIWRNEYTNKINKQALVRVEYNTASVFSNDLALLETLEDIDPGALGIKYTQVDVSIPVGVKYLVGQPKHNYRVYFKSGLNDANFRIMVSEFIERYRDSSTVIVPSRALLWWVTNPSWTSRYSQTVYYLDYDVESTIMIIRLVFGNLVRQTFKLEKKP